MTSKEFIEKALLGETSKDHCSSVVAIRNGRDVTVYSYGSHYPLVKIIGDKAFVNTRGYSNTTAKHIGWAFSAAANIVGWENVYHAPVSGSLTISDIIAGSEREASRLRDEMLGKKRTDTKVYRWLDTQLHRAYRTLEAATSLRLTEV